MLLLGLGGKGNGKTTHKPNLLITCAAEMLLEMRQGKKLCKKKSFLLLLQVAKEQTEPVIFTTEWMKSQVLIYQVTPSDSLAINYKALFSWLLLVASILHEDQELWLSKGYRIYPIGSKLQLMFMVLPHLTELLKESMRHV